MEFFFPADVFASFPGQPRHARAGSSSGSFAGPSTPRNNMFGGCGFDSAAFFADGGDFFTAIRNEQAAAAQAAARARAEQQARADAIRRARLAARRAAAEEQRRVAEERQARAYFHHVLEIQRRQEALERQRQFQIQLQRQRQLEREEIQRQQYAEYQRRKAYAIQRERERIAAMKAAEDQSKKLFFALNELLFGGLGFHGEEDENVEMEPTQPEDANAQPATSSSQPAAENVKGKGKARQEDEQLEQPMEVDTTEAPAQPSVPEASANATAADVDQDPEEVGPAPASSPAENSETVANESKKEAVAPKKDEVLVFTHAFPTNADFDKASIKADSINVSVDEEKRTVTVSGLWNEDSTVRQSPVARPASPTPSDSSTSTVGSRRGRSRSPKRARVSDVDENGNEIVTPEDNEDDFVEISFTRSAPASQTASVEKTFQLPEGASIDGLRAELSDDGLKLFTTKA